MRLNLQVLVLPGARRPTRRAMAAGGTSPGLPLHSLHVQGRHHVPVPYDGNLHRLLGLPNPGPVRLALVGLSPAGGCTVSAAMPKPSMRLASYTI